MSPVICTRARRFKIPAESAPIMALSKYVMMNMLGIPGLM
jgi:hypothetical protein